MSSSRVPKPLLRVGSYAEPKPSRRGVTVSTRLPKSEAQALAEAAAAAGVTCAEWLRAAALLHLKRPPRPKKSLPDRTLLAEIVGLRSLTQNLIAAVSDLPVETVQKIVRHADSIKEGKADEILRRLEDGAPGSAAEVK